MMINATQKLYENDAYCRNFKATVMSCEEADGFYYIVLDQTAFFPEGGGQDADTGVLNGLQVVDVQQKGELVVHKTAAEIPEGTEVQGEIDWDLRYSRMQSHTGEHILSGVVHSLFGYNNVGFHMGETTMTVDFDGALTNEDIEKIELFSNRAIYKNADISVVYPTEKELSELEYRSKIDYRDGIRIVKIGDIDCCACCAPHLSKTGETGLIKIISFMPYKQGTRMEVIAGINALKDYSALNTANKNLMKLLSVPRDKVEQAVRDQSASVGDLQYKYSQVSKKLALYEIDKSTVNNSVYALSKDLGYDELRFCANSLLEEGFDICLLFSKSGEEDYIYVISSKDKDVKSMGSKLNEAFNGKGGGRPNYVQGKIVASSQEELKSFAASLL